MSFWSKMKGWLNIGGVTLSILEVEQPITGKTGLIRGKLKISSKSGQKITQFTYRFLVDETKGKGAEKKATTTTIAETTEKVDREVKAGSAETVDFSLPYDMSSALEKLGQKGGFLGAVGQVGAFASKAMAEKGILDYYVEIKCSVQGSALSAGSKVPVRVEVGG